MKLVLGNFIFTIRNMMKLYRVYKIKLDRDKNVRQHVSKGRI